MKKNKKAKQMKLYKAKFTGRLIGEQGKPYRCEKEVMAFNEDDVKLLLPLTHERITRCSIEEVSYKVVKHFKVSGKRKTLYRYKTLEQARRIVHNFPHSNTSIVVFTKM